MSRPTEWLPGTLESHSESKALNQQASLRQAVHTRCVLERTVLIKDDIGDDDVRKEGVWNIRGTTSAQRARPPHQVPLSPQGKFLTERMVPQVLSFL